MKRKSKYSSLLKRYIATTPFFNAEFIILQYKNPNVEKILKEEQKGKTE